MGWYLNKFLTTWRAAVSKEYPSRSRKSDGTLGDARHAASVSEHNPDRDGSVDAWDMDVNLLGSSNAHGSAREDAAVEKLKREFQAQPGAQLWIHNGVIANKDVGKWKRRRYYGANPHKQHVHWQSDPDYERRTFSGDLDEDIVVTAINDVRRLAVPKTIPPWPKGSKPSYAATAPYALTVRKAQTRLKERGWKIATDGVYGPASARIVKAFQAEKKLKADAILGPVTWRALWAAKITRE